MAQDTQSKITSGPSKFDLMLALFDRKGSKPRIVSFTFEDQGVFPFQVIIEQVGIEDGSGESWMIKGAWVRGDIRGFEAHYRTDTRTGWIKEVH